MSASALVIVNRALQELGLPSVNTIESAPDDQTGWQSLGVLNALGAQLCRSHDWQFLEGIANFVGDGVTTQFPLPDDYGRMVNQTQWAAKSKRPLAGPVSAQSWSWIQYGLVSVGVFYRYRIVDNLFTVFPVPPVGEEFNFYYIKKDWVHDPIQDIYTDTVLNDTDETVFDEYLMISGVKFKLWAAKGMNTTELGREYEYMLAACRSQTQGAPVISLDHRSEQLYISGQNVPDGSWGA